VVLEPAAPQPAQLGGDVEAGGHAPDGGQLAVVRGERVEVERPLDRAVEAGGAGARRPPQRAARRDRTQDGLDHVVLVGVDERDRLAPLQDAPEKRLPAVVAGQLEVAHVDQPGPEAPPEPRVDERVELLQLAAPLALDDDPSERPAGAGGTWSARDGERLRHAGRGGVDREGEVGHDLDGRRTDVWGQRP
jgi:hypothetical protein